MVVDLNRFVVSNDNITSIFPMIVVIISTTNIIEKHIVVQCVIGIASVFDIIVIFGEAVAFDTITGSCIAMLEKRETLNIFIYNTHLGDERRKQEGKLIFFSNPTTL